MSPAVVIDTNVLVAANGKSVHAGLDCQLACINALEEITKRKVVVIDTAMRIIDEYRRHASPAGQPGLGDAFFKWLWLNQGNTDHCEQVEITPRDSDMRDFEEFPADSSLAGFDPADRKFVAVAIASVKHPRILNATDSDWWNFKDEIKGIGLKVDFLCLELF
jgi:hypothetical protein